MGRKAGRKSANGSYLGSVARRAARAEAVVVPPRIPRRGWQAVAAADLPVAEVVGRPAPITPDVGTAPAAPTASAAALAPMKVLVERGAPPEAVHAPAGHLPPLPAPVTPLSPPASPSRPGPPAVAPSSAPRSDSSPQPRPRGHVLEPASGSALAAAIGGLTGPAVPRPSRESRGLDSREAPVLGRTAMQASSRGDETPAEPGAPSERLPGDGRSPGAEGSVQTERTARPATASASPSPPRRVNPLDATPGALSVVTALQTALMWVSGGPDKQRSEETVATSPARAAATSESSPASSEHERRAERAPSPLPALARASLSPSRPAPSAPNRPATRNLHIGTVEVHVGSPVPSAPAPPARRAPRPAQAPIARGFTSTHGLRQS